MPEVPAATQRSPLVVAGVGNSMMGDEGVGIHIVRRLAARARPEFGIDWAEVGTSTMSLIHVIAHRRKAVVVDCARMGEEPGAIRRFTPGQVRSGKLLTRLSLHEGDLLQAIDLSIRLGEGPSDIVIFGIEPESVEPGDRLSPRLQASLDSYVRQVAAEVDAGCGKG